MWKTQWVVSELCLALADGTARAGLESAPSVLAGPRGGRSWRQRSRAAQPDTQAVTLCPATSGSHLRCLSQDISDPWLELNSLPGAHSAAIHLRPAALQWELIPRHYPNCPCLYYHTHTQSRQQDSKPQTGEGNPLKMRSCPLSYISHTPNICLSLTN